MKILKKILLLPLTLLFIFTIFLGYIIITDYRPEEIEASEIVNDNNVSITGDTFTVTTFNIGYCGLDKDQDFFMDGGTMSRSSSEEKTLENLQKVMDFISITNSDFYFLQEVDVSSTRSYNVNQLQTITDEFVDYSSTFSYNFKTNWVPIPIMHPHGKAYSGLLTLSKYSVDESLRYALPGMEPIPNRYFELDRSIMENIYSFENGKKLYMINIHLSAYDKGGTIRAEQVQFIINHITEIYNNGENYIIFGGDWNHLLDNDLYTDDLPEWVALLPETLFDSGFSLAYDSSVNTVRSNETVYIAGQSFETVIDGFLVSPNIQINYVEGHDLKFDFSDHNPVSINFTLLNLN
jgi:endonuclease/exonuclease/phosphatase family metal-dependent hydrolase